MDPSNNYYDARRSGKSVAEATQVASDAMRASNVPVTLSNLRRSVRRWEAHLIRQLRDEEVTAAYQRAAERTRALADHARGDLDEIQDEIHYQQTHRFATTAPTPRVAESEAAAVAEHERYDALANHAERQVMWRNVPDMD